MIRRASRIEIKKMRSHPCVVYSCPRCGRPFVTEAQMAVHFLQCGS